MEATIRPMSPTDREPVIDIFNYYIENSFAAYPENRVPYDFFTMLQNLTLGYPSLVLESHPEGTIAFAFLRPHNPLPAFKATAEITYFIKPGHVDKGLGGLLLQHLIEEGKEMGLHTLLASISSRNEQSIAFHLKNGFLECGRFKNIGRKFAEAFDVVWMQKSI